MFVIAGLGNPGKEYTNTRHNAGFGVIDALAEKYDLHRTDDRIEDYGAHFYFVFRCGKSWR